jgi:hypothetical protein
MTLDHALLLCGMLGESVVLYLLLRGKVWRTLPLFCTFILWSLLSDIFLGIVVWKVPGFYGKAYFYQLVPDSILQFAVLIELAWSILRPSRAALPRGTLYVLIALVAFTGAAIWPLAKMAVPANLSAHAELFVHFQQTVAILRVVCCLVMAGFSQILAIGWKDRELQVATGLGFFAIISLIVAVLHSHQDVGRSYEWLDLATSISYFGTLAYWVLSFSTQEQERREFSPQMQQILVQMGGGARTGRIALTNIPPKHSRKRD